MKILLIVDDYLPHSIKVAAKMMHELACEFVKRGCDVSVITPDHSIKGRYRHDTIDGVNVFYFKSGKIKNVRLIIRAFNELLISLRAWFGLKRVLKQNRHDLIIYYSPSIFWGPLVLWLKKKWNSPAYLILRDIFPQWVIDNGTLSNKSPVTLFFRLFERLNYQAADCIALQSPKNLSWFNGKYKNGYKTELLYNWADNKKSMKSGTFRKKHNLTGKTVFFYGGNVGQAQDMMNIIHLAEKMLPERNAFFVILGDGDEVELVKEFITLKHLTNTIYLPPVSQDEFRKILAEIDVGLFSLNKDHKTHNFPGKLLGYMAQSIPILGSINPGNDLRQILERYDAGLVSINGDDELFYKNAVLLLNDKKRRGKMGENSNILLCELFSVKNAADRINDYYLKLIQLKTGNYDV